MNIILYIAVFTSFLLLLSCEDAKEENRIYIGKGSFYILGEEDKRGIIWPISDFNSSKSCWDWKIEQNNLLDIFKYSKAIDESVSYYPAPCEYSYKVISGDTIAELIISSNGLIELIKNVNIDEDNNKYKETPFPKQTISKRLITSHPKITFPTELEVWNGECLGG